MEFADYLDVLMQNKYFYSLLVLVVFLILSKVVLLFFKNYLTRLAKKTETVFDDLIIEKIENPVSYIFVLIGLNLAFGALKLNGKFSTTFTHLVNTLIIFAITYIIVVIVDIMIDIWGMRWARRTKSSIDDDVLPLIHKFAKVTLFILGFVYILTEWGVAVGPFLASLGIAGIAIGFAVKDSLANIFGGISLILDKNFKVGDTVRLESGENGRVKDVGLRSTKIRTWDGEVLIIPNGQLANTKIVNYAQPEPKARSVIDFGVVYGSNPEQVKKVALSVVKKIPEILKDPEPFVKFKRMNDFSLDFKLYYWVDSYKKRFKYEDVVMTKLYAALRKNKIGIPFPTRTVYLKK